MRFRNAGIRQELFNTGHYSMTLQRLHTVDKVAFHVHSPTCEIFPRSVIGTVAAVMLSAKGHTPFSIALVLTNNEHNHSPQINSHHLTSSSRITNSHTNHTRILLSVWGS